MIKAAQTIQDYFLAHQGDIPYGEKHEISECVVKFSKRKPILGKVTFSVIKIRSKNGRPAKYSYAIKIEELHADDAKPGSYIVVGTTNPKTQIELN